MARKAKTQGNRRRSVNEIHPGQASAQHAETRRKTNWTDLFLCVLISLLALLPFLTKAVHLDDTVFIYIAKQISTDPMNPFGFSINWYGQAMPMHEVQQNGPLSSYYLAVAGSLLGWSEFALHTAYLVPTIAAIVGMYFLSKRLCPQPITATLVMVFSPVFLVSASTLMCDVPMLALWIWAVVLWIRSADQRSHGWAVMSVLLVGAGIVTKYYAAALIPLLLAYSLLRWSDVRWRALYLIVPILMTLAYDAAMIRMYGHSLLRGASVHALEAGSLHQSLVYRIIVATTFVGGCLVAVLFYSPLIWPRKHLCWASILMIPCALLLPTIFQLPGSTQGWVTEFSSVLIIIQFVLMFFGGMSLVFMTAKMLMQRRDADTWLLGMWLAGTFFFSAVLNWTVNGRSLLPLAPPAGLMLARCLSKLPTPIGPKSAFLRYLPVGLSAIVALSVTWADAWWANSARTAASVLNSQFSKQVSDREVFFTGHWGFQYYMDGYGFRPLDRTDIVLREGDVIILPKNNNNVPIHLLRGAAQVETVAVSVHPFLATMRKETGAGFYTSQLGPLPYSLGHYSSEVYSMMTFTAQDLLKFRIEQLEALVRQNPDSMDHLQGLAEALMSAGRIDEAIENLEVIVHAEPNNVRAINDLAWIVATLPPEMGQPRMDALSLARRANELTGGRSPECLDTLAAALADAKHFDEAVVAAQQALRLLGETQHGELFDQISARIELYRQRHPYRETYSSSAIHSAVP